MESNRKPLTATPNTREIPKKEAKNRPWAVARSLLSIRTRVNCPVLTYTLVCADQRIEVRMDADYRSVCLEIRSER